MKLTVKLKLKPTVEQIKQLRRTLEAANEASNYASQRAWQSECFRQSSLHKLVYRELRAKFALPAQMAVRVIARVADAYKLRKDAPVRFKMLAAIAFDERNHRIFRDRGYVSISTLEGRLKVPYATGERQHGLLQFQHGESDLVQHRKKWYLLATVNVEEPPTDLLDNVLGVDFGIVNIATDSDGETYSGKNLTAVRHRYADLRQSLQKSGTKNAKRHLKTLSGRERDFARTLNHTIAKRIVEKARRQQALIALEDLKGIRSRTTVRRAQRYLYESWPFAQLRFFLEYKAKLAGVPVIAVDPRHTSQTCPSCGLLDPCNRTNRDEFRCVGCGNAGPADHIAAINISRRAAINQPIATSASSHAHLSCKLQASAGSS